MPPSTSRNLLKRLSKLILLGANFASPSRILCNAASTRRASEGHSSRLLVEQLDDGALPSATLLAGTTTFMQPAYQVFHPVMEAHSAACSGRRTQPHPDPRRIRVQ